MPRFEFRDDVEAVYTQDNYYDLFEGGYIKPEEMLASSSDVLEVQRAVQTIKDFFNEAIEDGILEIG